MTMPVYSRCSSPVCHVNAQPPRAPQDLEMRDLQSYRSTLRNVLAAGITLWLSTMRSFDLRTI